MIARRLKTLLFLWAAITALIMTVACSRGGESPGARSAPAAPHPAPLPVNPQVNPLLNNTGKTAPIPTNTSTGSVTTSRNTDPINKNTQPAGGGGPGKLVVTQSPLNPNGQTPEQIFDGKDPAVMTDTVDSQMRNSLGDALYYSDAAVDNIAALLRDRFANRTDTAQITLDQQFIDSIGLTKFAADRNSGPVNMSILMPETNTEVKIKGKLDKMAHSIFGSKTSAPFLEADFQCLDAVDTCTAARVNLTETTTPNETHATEVIRSTDAYLYVKAKDPTASMNPEFQRFVNILKNTIANSGSGQTVTNTVQRLKLLTTHVINGTSSFQIEMQMDETQSGCSRVTHRLTWWGPLVKPLNSDIVEQEVNRRSEFSKSCNGDNGRGDLGVSITRSRLMRNDGKGNLQLELTIHSSSGADDETILLTIARIHQATAYNNL